MKEQHFRNAVYNFAPETYGISALSPVIKEYQSEKNANNKFDYGLYHYGTREFNTEEEPYSSFHIEIFENNPTKLLEKCIEDKEFEPFHIYESKNLTLDDIKNGREFAISLFEKYYEKLKQAKEENFEREKILNYQISTTEINRNIPKCPTCGSSNINKISGINRTTSIGLWGIFSSKIGKTMECKNCGYKW